MFENLVETIMGDLNAIDDFAGMTRAEKTIEVKTVLVDACNAIDDDVATYASPIEELNVDGAEWLYDVTAILYNIPVENCFSRTVLVAECEWDDEENIMIDFQKLLLARADVRVMVFDGTWHPEYQELFEIFETNIDNNQQAQLGDIWLFAAWTPEGWRFRRIDIEMYKISSNYRPAIHSPLSLVSVSTSLAACSQGR